MKSSISHGANLNVMKTSPMCITGHVWLPTISVLHQTLHRDAFRSGKVRRMPVLLLMRLDRNCSTHSIYPPFHYFQTPHYYQQNLSLRVMANRNWPRLALTRFWFGASISCPSSIIHPVVPPPNVFADSFYQTYLLLRFDHSNHRSAAPFGH